MARRFAGLVWLVALIIFVRPAFAAPRQAEIDPGIWLTLSRSPSAAVLVRMRDPAAALAAGAPANAARLTTSSAVEQRIQTISDSQQDLKAALDAAGKSYRSYWIVNVIALQADSSLLQQLAVRQDVLYIESDPSFSVPLETPASIPAPSALSAIEPGLSYVHAPDLWTLGIKGSGSVVASADTGVQWDHSSLKSHYRGWNGTSADHNYNWWDAIHSQISFSSNPCGYNTTAPCDDYGHGTHTVGTMLGDDGTGHQIGMAPEAKWIGCRNMDNGVGRPSTYIECLQFFIAPTDLNGQNPNPALRPFVIDNSYSCPTSELCASTSLHDAIVAVRTAGIFMSVSAGNSGSSCGTINEPPGIEPLVFTVGGVNAATGSMSTFSSRGPALYNGVIYNKPALIAPADNVYSSYKGGIYTSLSGTSMAAPHVAGAVALLWSAFPDLQRDVLSTEVLLKITTTPFTTSETCGGLPAGSVPNNTSGWGILNVLAAYNRWNAHAGVLYKYILPNISR